MQVIIIVCLIASISVQSTEQRPEDVVKSFWDAVQASDWAKCAQMVHHQSLSKSRDRANRLAKVLFEMDGGTNLNSYFGVIRMEDYEQLRDVWVLERMFPLMYFPYTLEEIQNALSYKIIGITRERDDLAHILYRTDIKILDSEGKRLKVARIERDSKVIGIRYDFKLPDPDDERAEVISVKKDKLSWKILLADDVFNTIDTMEKNIAEFNDNMRKLAEELAKQQKTRKSKRAVPRR